MVDKKNSNNAFKQACDILEALDKIEEEKKKREKEYYDNLFPEDLWKRDLRDIKDLLYSIKNHLYFS